MCASDVVDIPKFNPNVKRKKNIFDIPLKMIRNNFDKIKIKI